MPQKLKVGLVMFGLCVLTILVAELLAKGMFYVRDSLPIRSVNIARVASGGLRL